MTNDDIKDIIAYIDDADSEYNDDENIFERVIRLPEDLHPILLDILKQTKIKS